MGFIRFIIFIFLTGCFSSLHAQTEQVEKKPRILLLLDGSSSMLQQWTKDEIRFDAAAHIIDKLVDSVYKVNKDVEFALRVYGHQHPTVDNDCYDTKREVMFSKDNYTQLMLRLEALHPLGVSPIAYSLQQAAENDLKNLREYKYSLILITDGGESCDGDICEVVEQLLKKKIDFRPYILSLVDYEPLMQQYACLGDYLLVTKPEEIDPVVGKIVDAYKQTFIQPRAVNELIKTTSAASPSILKVKAPDIKINTTVKEEEPKQEEPEPVVTKIPEPEPEPVKQSSNIVVQDEVKEKPKEAVTKIAPTKGGQKLPQRYATRAFSNKSVPQYTPPIPDPEPEKPTEPVYKPMPTTTVKTSNTVKKTPPAPPKVKEPKYSIEREEAKETSLELFFTNGKGKYYETAPEVILLDPATGKEVHRFVRDVNAYGQPRPQILPAGTYNLTVTGKENMLVKNLEIRPMQKNKLAVFVGNSSLKFSYATDRERPVKEFAATVKKNFEVGAKHRQLCTDQREYEPGNYHIEISTNPISHRSVDLEFNAEVDIAIDEPGQIVVLNPNNYAKVEFYYQNGDKYERFNPMDVTGDNSRQQFLIQPGFYKVAYLKNPKLPNQKPIVKNFIIKSNIITEITLD